MGEGEGGETERGGRRTALLTRKIFKVVNGHHENLKIFLERTFKMLTKNRQKILSLFIGLRKVTFVSRY